MRTFCGVRGEMWCRKTFPDDAAHAERRQCATRYAPRCMGCLLGVVYAQKRADGHRGRESSL